MKRKGFTLIELIVVMAIIGILALLALPKYKEYTKEAKLTEIKVNVKELENASLQYYMRYNNWPRLSDEPYTSEELETYSERIRDKTGSEIVLDVEGNYYDIDYAKINNYLKAPKNKENYILRNPVGSVYYLEDLTDEGLARVDYSSPNLNKPIKGESLLTNEEITAKINQGFIPISSAEELNNIRDQTINVFGVGTEWEGSYQGGLNQRYIQIKDINLSLFSEGEGWEPIGSNSKYFSGIYDGNGFIISNLYVNRPSTNNVGLFGYPRSATITNIGVVNAYVEGGSNTGGLIGYLGNYTNLSNSYYMGDIKGTNQVGGVVGGTIHDTSVEKTYFIGNIIGISDVGGVVGYNIVSKLSDSYAMGNIKGVTFVGGISGRMYATTISNTYFTGDVEGNEYVGGLLGRIEAYSSVTHSYSISNVIGNNYVGSLAGHMSGSNTSPIYETNLNYCYSLESDVPIVGYKQGSISRIKTIESKHLSEIEFQQQSSFVGLDFNNVWKIKENSYPTLRWQK